MRGGDALDVEVGGGSHVAPGDAAAERESVGGRGELGGETWERGGAREPPSEKTLTLLSLRRLRDSLRWKGEMAST